MRRGGLIVVQVGDEDDAAWALRVEQRDGRTVGEVSPRESTSGDTPGAVPVLEAAVEAHGPEATAPSPSTSTLRENRPGIANPIKYRDSFESGGDGVVAV